MTIPATHAAVAAVDAQPSQRSQPTTMNFPITLRLAVISIITGTAAMPLMTALQCSGVMVLRAMSRGQSPAPLH
jgi:hypothetical protein